jgi:GT2 family glycosyltransferase
MSVPRPEVSVVVATYNRAARLSRLLEALRAQTHPRERFEVVVVDDGSSDETGALLGREAERGELRLRVLERERNGGWAVAREEGWRAATGEIVAFTDDDCVPDPEWLAAGLRACEQQPGAIVQGRTEPIPEEHERLHPLVRPFTRTLSVPGPDPHFQTCNVFYSRSLLERAGGFDTEAFARVPGEDADLAWRALELGAGAAFAPEALVHHAILRLGPLGKLRYAAGWDLRVYARHPGLRRAYFKRRLFWKGSHYLLVRALVARLLPRRMRLARAWLAGPYVIHLAERGRVEGGGLLCAPYFLVHDLIELAAAMRSTIRYRVPML